MFLTISEILSEYIKNLSVLNKTRPAAHSRIERSLNIHSISSLKEVLLKELSLIQKEGISQSGEVARSFIVPKIFTRKDRNAELLDRPQPPVCFEPSSGPTASG